MRIRCQCLHVRRDKSVFGALLAVLIVAPPIPNAHSNANRTQETRPLLLVLVRPTTFSLHIVRANSNGGLLVDLSRENAFEGEPALSPDGKRIAFTAVKADRTTSDIWNMNLNGAGRTQISHSAAHRMAMSPAWSPDGTKLVYCNLSTEEQKPLDASLHTMNADGSHDKVIGSGMYPGWPKDHSITYSGEDENGGVTYIMESDGKGAKKLVSAELIGGWSADGRHLLYSKGSNINLAHVFVAASDGTHPIQVKGTEFEHEYGAQWAADGRHLLFNRVVDNPIALGMMQVITADAEGKNPKAITNTDSGLMLSNGSGILLLGFRMAH